MAGRNQHHIPQFLQRGFAVVGSNGHRIWRFDRERLPTRPRSIRSTASEDWFYSDDPVDGSRTLDDEITDEERPIFALLSSLPSLGAGAFIDASEAATLVTHLAPRTAHFRQTIEKGMRQLVVGASELFTSEEKLTALLGLDKNEPNEVFRSHISETLKSNEAIASLGLPDRVIERIAFYLAKEQFETTLGETMPAFRQLFHKWADEAETIARRGHNKALAKRDGPNARYDYLASLHWRIVAADKEGAILPDCVAIAVAYDGSTAPLMLADWDETAAVLMPISSESLLQGIRAGREVPPTFSFNSEAARASHRFFLAASNQPAISALQPLVDERASRLVDDAINHAFKDFLPKSEASSCAEPAEDEAAQESEAARVEEDWSYQLSFLGCADEGTAAEIGKAVSLLVDALGRSLPLKRLDGITFAADYPAALNVLDRGVLGPEPPSTIDPSIGTGIAQTVIIVRDGTVKCRIVLAGWIGHALIDMDEAQADWAIGVLSRQLSLVALTDILDTRLPGVLLQPIRDPLSGWLYGAVGAAIDGYMASHMSAGFGDPEELAAGFRELLTQALDRMREKVLAARLAYRHDADLDTLLSLSKSTIRHVLLFSADLLGHCAALDLEAAPRGSELDDALRRAGLQFWLPRFASDLEAHRQRLGVWRSFDEYLAFNVHVERLMWQLGMIPWDTGAGLRVEVPLGTDAEALLAETTPPPKGNP